MKQIVIYIVEIANAKENFKHSLYMRDKNFCYKLGRNFTHLKLKIKIYQTIFGETNILNALLTIQFL